MGVVRAVSPIATCGVADAARMRSRDRAESTARAASRSVRPRSSAPPQPVNSPAADRQRAGHSTNHRRRGSKRVSCMDRAPLRASCFMERTRRRKRPLIMVADGSRALNCTPELVPRSRTPSALGAGYCEFRSVAPVGKVAQYALRSGCAMLETRESRFEVASASALPARSGVSENGSRMEMRRLAGASGLPSTRGLVSA